MKIVDNNNWDKELQNMLNINADLKKEKIVCKIMRVICWGAFLVGFGFSIQSSIVFENNEETKELPYWISAVALIINYYLGKYLKWIGRMEYEIKNIVFCLIDEETLIDAEYIKEQTMVKVTFKNTEDDATEEFFVECEVKEDDMVEEDTLVIEPNYALLLLKSKEEKKED